MINEERLAEVQAVLTGDPAPLRVVHKRVGCWCKTYIGQVLRELVKHKRAVAVGDLKRRMYRAA